MDKKFKKNMFSDVSSENREFGKRLSAAGFKSKPTRRDGKQVRIYEKLP